MLARTDVVIALLLVSGAVGGCEKAAPKQEAPTVDKAAVEVATDQAPKDSRPQVARAEEDSKPRIGDPKSVPPPPVVKKTKKGDCSIDYAPRPERDPSPMCKIAGGTFMMGSADDDPLAHDDEKPQHQVTLSPFYIDQFEVTVAQYLLFLNTAGGHEFCESAMNSECVGVRPSYEHGMIEKRDGQYVAVEGRELYPISGVTLGGAQLYCDWVGKTLPTEAQWEFAARHDPKTGEDLVYPWGNGFDLRRVYCGDDCGIALPLARIAPVGSFDGSSAAKGDGSSPHGLFDMAANVSEMVADCYLLKHQACDGSCLDPIQKLPNRCGGVTKGILTRKKGLERIVRAANRAPGDGSTPSSAVGFRCARVEDQRD